MSAPGTERVLMKLDGFSSSGIGWLVFEYVLRYSPGPSVLPSTVNSTRWSGTLLTRWNVLTQLSSVHSSQLTSSIGLVQIAVPVPWPAPRLIVRSRSLIDGGAPASSLSGSWPARA